MGPRSPLALAASIAASLLLPTPAAAAPQTQAKSYVVVLDKMKYGALPAQLRRGDRILWVNRDIFRHSVTAANKSFDVDLPPASRRVMVVKSTGAFPFTCKYHPGMRGVLRVAAQ
jgi:plastocyanin